MAEKRVDLTYAAGGGYGTITRYNDLAAGGGSQVAQSVYGYNSHNRLTSLVNTPAGGNGSSWSWAYNATTYGHPSTLVSQFTNNGSTTFYRYDGTGQLIYAGPDTSPATQDYVWDFNGNQQGLVPEYLVIGQGNQLLSNTEEEYTYDAEGNRLTRTMVDHETIYEWDHRNRLVSVTYAEFAVTLGKIEYAYDAFDRRVSKTVTDYVSGVPQTPRVEYFVYDQDHSSALAQALLEFVDEDGPGGAAAELSRRYLGGNDVDQFFAQEDLTQEIEEPARVLWLLQDNLGSVRDVIDNEGEVVNRIDYDAFGNILSVVDPSDDDQETDLLTNVTFTGQMWDADLGLYYYKARWYDPVTMTFVSRDPLGFDAGDANLYRYVGNSPVNWRDPTGMHYEVPPKPPEPDYPPYLPPPGHPHWWNSPDAPWPPPLPPYEPPQPPNPTTIRPTYRSAEDAHAAFLLGVQQECGLLTAIFIPNGWLDLGTGAMSGFAGVPGLRPRRAELPTIECTRPCTGYTRHGMNQAISRYGVGPGVSVRAILDALTNPKSIQEQTEGTKYIGSDATVVLNKCGEIKTVWPNNSKGYR